MNDHYRLFSMLEHLLLTVGNFKEQLLYQVPTYYCRVVVEEIRVKVPKYQGY